MALGTDISLQPSKLSMLFNTVFFTIEASFLQVICKQSLFIPLHNTVLCLGF